MTKKKKTLYAIILQIHSKTKKKKNKNLPIYHLPHSFPIPPKNDNKTDNHPNTLSPPLTLMKHNQQNSIYTINK